MQKYIYFIKQINVSFFYWVLNNCFTSDWCRVWQKASSKEQNIKAHFTRDKKTLRENFTSFSLTFRCLEGNLTRFGVNKAKQNMRSCNIFFSHPPDECFMASFSLMFLPQPATFSSLVSLRCYPFRSRMCKKHARKNLMSN